MSEQSSRRNFLTAGLALPATALAVTTAADSPKPAAIKDPKSALNFRTLGKTGLKVTTVGFGCMVTSDPTVISRAVDMGINLFDSARVYQGGNNERMVGAALKGHREKLVLSSKTLARDKTGALADLDTSLRELQTDHLDIWYLHSKSRPQDVTDELMEAQQIAKKQGKMRFSGISLHGGHREVIPVVIKTGHFDVLLVSYNFTMAKTIDDLLADAHAAGLGVVGMKVLAGGYRPIPVVPNDPKVIQLLHREGAMLAAIKWTIRNRNIDTTIPSMVDIDQLEENMNAMTVPFAPADEKVLAAQLDYLRPRYCRMCGGCGGACPKGLPVADVLRYLTYAEGYGEFPLGRENFLTMPEELRAVRCGDCESCAIQCPNGVRVRERIGRAQELFA